MFDDSDEGAEDKMSDMMSCVSVALIGIVLMLVGGVGFLIWKVL